LRKTGRNTNKNEAFSIENVAGQPYAIVFDVPSQCGDSNIDKQSAGLTLFTFRKIY